MAGLFCGCVADTVNPNFGTSSKEVVKDKTFGYVLMRKYDDEGNFNVINASDFVDGELPADFINQKINESDPSKRWYLLKNFKATTNERADPNTEQPTGGNSQITDKGVRSLTAQLWNTGNSYLKNIEGLACEDLAFFYIDACGSVFGNVSSTDQTVLKPVKIAPKTFYARTIDAVEGVAAKISVQFEIDQIEKDSDLQGIKASNLGVDMLSADSLLNLIPTISNITATGFDVQLDLEYGGFESKFGQKGFVAGDFYLYDNTGDAEVTITSVTESATVNGSYTFVIPSTAASNLTLSGSVVASGALQGSYTKQGFEISSTSFDTP